MIHLSIDHPAETHVVTKTSLPSWVSSTWQFDQEAYPEHYLLIDTQIHLEEKMKTHHVAYRLLNDADVQDKSTLKFTFDPAYETLQFHTLRIYRDGEVIDKLDKVNIHVVQRENKIEEHLYDGSLTGIIFLDDIREGDTIEYAYSVKGFNPIFKSHFCTLHYLQASEPIGEYSLRIIAPNKQRLFFKQHLTQVEPLINQLDANHKEWVWKLSHIAEKSSEDDQPEWHEDFPFVEVTSFAKWQDVAEWGEPIFDLPSNLNAHCPKAMLDLVSQWKKESPKKEDQALKAIRFVQDKVRYLGIENGINSHQPNDPANVFTNRFGDCKDKTQLLRAFLTLLDIESHPTLVNPSLSKSLTNYLPSYAIFNHAILQIVINKQSYWIDSTISYQGGTLSENFHPHYAYGLVLKNNSRELTPIPESVGGSTEILTTFLLKNGKEAEMQVTTTHKNCRADSFRNTYKKWGAHRFAKDYENAYSCLLGHLKAIKEFEIEDHRERNEIVTKEFYLVDEFLDKEEDSGKTTVSLHPYHLLEELKVAIEPKRETPFSHAFPFHVKETYRLIREDRDWRYFNPEEYHFVNQTFEYSVKSQIDQKVLTLDFEYRSLNDHVKPVDISEHRDLLAKARAQSHYTFQVDQEETTLDRAIKGTSAVAIAVGLLYQVFFYLKRRKS